MKEVISFFGVFKSLLVVVILEVYTELFVIELFMYK